MLFGQTFTLTASPCCDRFEELKSREACTQHCQQCLCAKCTCCSYCRDQCPCNNWATQQLSAISLTRCLCRVMTEWNVSWLTTLHSTMRADAVISWCIGTSFSPISLHTWTKGYNNYQMSSSNSAKFLDITTIWWKYKNFLIISIHNILCFVKAWMLQEFSNCGMQSL